MAAVFMLGKAVLEGKLKPFARAESKSWEPWSTGLSQSTALVREHQHSRHDVM